jgi:hypothetical protein
MHRTTILRPWAVWLAVLIAVLGALALANSGASGAFEVCTPQGMRIVAPDPTSSSAALLNPMTGIAAYLNCESNF